MFPCRPTSEPDAALPAGIGVGGSEPEPLPFFFAAHHDPLAISVGPPPFPRAIGLVGRLQRHIVPAARVALADELLGAPCAVVAAKPSIVFLCYPPQRGFAVQLAIGKCWHAGRYVLRDTASCNSQLGRQCRLRCDRHDAEPDKG